MFDELLEQEYKELELLSEVTAKRKRVIRKGKVTKKRKCPSGYKLVDGKRCKKQSAGEKRKRSRGAKRGSRKGKAARRRSFQRSIKKRRRYGL